MSYLSLRNINKIYPQNIQAVFDFSIDINEGEFIVLVGPSGCGKSTVLRMIAGLEDTSSGDIRLQKRRINHLAPSDRNVAMVFQDYALYGNMTVYQNIGFSLTIQGEKPAQIHDRVMNVSKSVSLFDYLNRYPKALSGGQKQRVAMGRSIAKQAKVLLMDEPLSNLDAKLRQQTRHELSMLHQELNSTIVYVTHDQIEAMTLANRIIVMNEGRIQQVGTPHEIYHYPQNIFTASFIGIPQINLIKGCMEGDKFTCINDDGEPLFTFKVSRETARSCGGYEQSVMIMGLRPEHIRLPDPDKEIPENKCQITATVETFELLGAEYNAVLNLNGCLLNSRIPARSKIDNGQILKVVCDTGKALFFDEKTGNRINGQS